MQFRTGLSVKPKEIQRNGLVIFTDGTNDVTPNQADCEAYGYTYNEETQTCQAFHYSPTTQEGVRNITNVIRGQNNFTEKGTRNTFILGQNNTTKGDNKDSIIVGDNNEIALGVNNATVLGSYGVAQRDGEIVFGGGGFNGAGKGYGQSSIISLSGTTTNATPTKLKVSNSSSTEVIARASTSSFQGFEAKLIGVRTGGTAGGSVDDRVFINVAGLVHERTADQTKTTLGSHGTVTGWTGDVIFTAPNDMFFAVTGAANMNISWSCTLHLYEMKV